MRLGDIATYINGYAFKPEDWGEKGLPIIRIQDLTGTSYQMNYYEGEYPEKIEVNTGDVLISWSASIGVYIWDKGKALLNQHIFKVQFDKIDINKEYFVYAVKYNLGAMVSQMHGATMKHIVKKDFDSIEIPYPNMEKQKIIAKKLVCAETIIYYRKQQLEQLDMLIKARFVEMFGDPVRNAKGWETKALNDVCDGIGDGLHGTPEYDENGKYPFINGNNLIDGKIVINDATKYINQSEYERLFLKINDNAVLISINGTLGKLAFYQREKVALGKSVCYCNLKYELNKYFAYGIMESKSFNEFLELSSTKSTIKNVGLKAMREFKVILPPIELQKQYANFVQQVDKSKLVVQKSLDEAQLLFDSLMQKYFG